MNKDLSIPVENTVNSSAQTLFDNLARSLQESIEALYLPQKDLTTEINSISAKIETIKKNIPYFEEELTATYSLTENLHCLCQIPKECDQCHGTGFERVTLDFEDTERREKAKKNLAEINRQILHHENSIAKLKKTFAESKDPKHIYIRQKAEMFASNHPFFKHQSAFRYLIDSLINPSIRDEPWFFVEMLELAPLLEPRDKDKALYLISDRLHHSSKENFPIFLDLCVNKLGSKERQIISSNLYALGNICDTSKELTTTRYAYLLYVMAKLEHPNATEKRTIYQTLFGLEIDDVSISHIESQMLSSNLSRVVSALDKVLETEGYAENKKEQFFCSLSNSTAANSSNARELSSDERFSYQEYLDDCKLANEINQRLIKSAKTPNFKPILLSITDFQEFYAYNKNANDNVIPPFLIPIYLTQSELAEFNKDNSGAKALLAQKNIFEQWDANKKNRFRQYRYFCQQRSELLHQAAIFEKSENARSTTSCEKTTYSYAFWKPTQSDKFVAISQIMPTLSNLKQW